jgi:hypothetical protein
MPVRIREGDLQSLAAAIVRAVTTPGFVRPTAHPSRLQRRIVELIAHNLEEDAALEAEAERLAEAHARQMVGMDHRKIIQGIKERLARDRGFAL